MMDIKTRIARTLRRLGEWKRLPDWAWFPVQYIAFVTAPHSLTCRICGAKFAQLAFGSKVHAARAYAHFIDVHERETAR